MASKENFYKRMRELADVDKSVNESQKSNNAMTLVDFQRSNDGTAYGIVKENHHYYIKKALIKESDKKLNPTDFTYIDGLANKGKYQYNSLAEAEKNRNLFIKNINEAWSQGGVYFKNQVNENSAPKLDTDESVDNVIKNAILEGKKNIAIKKEESFKATLPQNRENKENLKRGLMPESADKAVKKALGRIDEEALSTADSQINVNDSLANKTSQKHESPQAPVNDSNAKKEADRGHSQPSDLSTSDSEIKDSDAVSEKTGKEAPQAPINDSNAKKVADKGHNQPSDLSTSDSEINANDSLANKTSEKHDAPQAPVNDTNAKKLADARNISEGSDLSTADSEIKDGDVVSDKKGGKEKPEAPINDENAKSEADKAMAKDTAKTDAVVKEDINKGQPFESTAKTSGGDKVTADSDQTDADRIVNSKKVTTQPESDHSDKKKADKEVPESKGKELKADAPEKDIDDEDVINEAIKALKILTEGDDLSTADSEIDAKTSPANEEKGNMSFEKPKNLKKGTSEHMDDNKISESEDIDEAGEEEIEAAADKLDQAEDKAAEEKGKEAAPDSDVDLDVDVDNEPAPEPEMGGGEDMPVDDAPPVDDMPVDDAPEVDGGEDMPAEDGDGGEDIIVKEIERLVGKLGEKVRDAKLEPEPAKGYLKSILSSFEDKLPDMDIEDRKELSDKILKAESTKGDDGEEAPEVDGGEHIDTGLDGEAQDAIDNEIKNMSAGGEVEEDAPMQVNGEDAPMGESDCSECGTFEQYMESRGYSTETIGECSVMEMASVVSGYANAFNEGLNDGDFENVGKYVNDDVLKEVEDYGHADFAGKVKPFVSEEGVSFGSVEPTLQGLDVEEGEAEDMDGDGDIDSVDYLAKRDQAIEKAMKNEDEEEVEVEEPEEEETAFAPVAQTLGVATPSPERSEAKSKRVDVDLNSGRVSVEVNESNEKIRKYIRERIEVLSGKRKDTMNESKKSPNLKKLDALIEKQYGQFIKNTQK